MAKIVFFYVPCKDREEAEDISKKLLNNKLIFCANVITDVNSFYLWETKLCNSKEAILLVKTIKSLEKKVYLEIKKLHSYKTPGIFSFQLDSLNPDYNKWINSCLK